MSKAVRATLRSQFKTISPEGHALSDGFLYLTVIETAEVIFLSKAFKRLASDLGQTGKPVLLGTFWDGPIEYEWQQDGDSTFNVRLGGAFAFELFDPEALDGYDVDDGDIESLQVSWAIDGDSEKQILALEDFSGSLSDVEEDDEFEEL